MGDTIPFFVLLFIIAVCFAIYLVLKPRQKSPLALDDRARIKEWHNLLLEFDEIAQLQINDRDIRPFLPPEMQTQLRKLHARVHDNI